MHGFSSYAQRLAQTYLPVAATYVADITNITLTSLADFPQNFADELASIRIEALEERAVCAGQRFLAIWDLEESNRDTVLSS
jgi:hypothetical protein